MRRPCDLLTEIVDDLNAGVEKLSVAEREEQRKR
jgi:hypothetical protein